MNSCELLTIEEVSAILRVPQSWIYARTAAKSPKKGDLPYLKLGRLLRFRRGEVLDWLDRQHSGVQSSGTQTEGVPQAVDKAQLN